MEIRKILTIWIILLALPFVLADSYTSNSKTICKNSVCTLNLYSGTEFVE